MSEIEQREPHILIVDDDPRVIDFYREALQLPHTEAEQEAEQEMDEMFALLEGEDEPLHPSEQPGHCRAVTATQGLEALRIFSDMEETGDPFDLVLLDMRMPPGIDGLEVALELRLQRPDLPIIFFTAYSDYKDEYLKEKVGGEHSLLRKPISHELLRAEVERLLPERICFETD